MTDTDRELLKRTLSDLLERHGAVLEGQERLVEGQRALERYLGDQAAAFGRMDERIGLVFQRIEERQRRASLRAEAIQADLKALEVKAEDSDRNIVDALEELRAHVVGRISTIEIGRAEDVGVRKVVVWIVAGGCSVAASILTAGLVTLFHLGG